MGRRGEGSGGKGGGKWGEKGEGSGVRGEGSGECLPPLSISFSDMPVQLAISLTDNHASSSTTIFTAAMLALVTVVLGIPGRVSSSAENFPALKALTHLKTVHMEMV